MNTFAFFELVTGKWGTFYIYATQQSISEYNYSTTPGIVEYSTSTGTVQV
jgi:hypothetical protein